jgi:Flp pilus assembly pilin Flp
MLSGGALRLREKSPAPFECGTERFSRKRALTAIEYGLVVTLIFLAVVAGMNVTGTSLGDLYRGALQRISDAIS